MKDTNEPPEQPEEPPIVMIALDRKSYYLYKGEDYINQVLLEDGDFPRPVLCLHFGNVIDARMAIGEGFSLSQYWGINPEIVNRLRDREELIEKDV